MQSYYLGGAKSGSVNIELQRRQIRLCEYRAHFLGLLNRFPLAISAQNLASEAGWSLHDLLNNPTYISLHRSHNLCLETIQESRMF